MDLKKTIFFCLLLICFQNTQAQVKDTLNGTKTTQNYLLKNGTVLIYNKPHFFDFVTKLPKNVVGTARDFGETNNLILLGSASVATAALLPIDQFLLENCQDIGKKWNLPEVAHYTSFGPISIVPPSATSAVYLIGNGATPILLSLGFATYGILNKDYRSLNTASGLMQGLLTTGVFSQTIKRISGRQSPAPAIIDGNPGGDWNPFPSFAAFSKQTPNYDALPSGHLMTATATLYVIAGNYPDKKWIKPVGFALMGLLSFQMVQSSVHWTSDYPLALAMGYIIGKNIVKNNVTEIKATKDSKKKYTYNFNASRFSYFSLIGLNVRF